MSHQPPPERHGWDLVTSRPLTSEQMRQVNELAAIETGTKKPRKEQATPLFREDQEVQP